MAHHLVGTAEIAEMLGVSRQRVAQIIGSYDDFPAPEVELAGGRIWSRTAVETWIAGHPERGTTAGTQPKDAPDSVARGGFERFSDPARAVVVRAQEEARLLRHNYIGTEHLLVALFTQSGPAEQALVEMGVTAEGVRAAVRDAVGEGSETPKGHIPFTPRAMAALQAAITHAFELGHELAEPEDVLFGLLALPEGVAVQLLTNAYGLDHVSIRERVLTHRYRFERLPSGHQAASDPSERGTKCSFCGKSRTERQKLLAGPGVYICDECVALCNEILGEELGGTSDATDDGSDRSTLEALKREVTSLSERLTEALERLEDPDA